MNAKEIFGNILKFFETIVDFFWTPIVGIMVFFDRDIAEGIWNSIILCDD